MAMIKNEKLRNVRFNSVLANFAIFDVKTNSNSAKHCLISTNSTTFCTEPLQTVTHYFMKVYSWEPCFCYKCFT